jgi:phosphotriesterase-related protein
VHEHLFIDLQGSSFVPPPKELEWIADAAVGRVPAEDLSANSCSVRDNLVLGEADTAAEELAAFRAAGGRTIVDVTPVDIGRSPERLRSLSEATGVSIVMGCGHYCEIAFADDVAGRSEDALLDEILLEVTEGVPDSGIRPGIIGEIGVNGEERGSRRCVGEMTPGERRSLRAAARAAEITGYPMTVHLPSRASAVPVVLDELEAVGAPLERISLSHMDAVDDFAVHEQALDRGVWIQYDCFGMALTNDWYTDPGDERRLVWLERHRIAGRLDRVLVSHDVWCKAQLAAYGGNGYAHLLTRVAPRLQKRGFSPSELDCLFTGNPGRFLTIASLTEAP